MACRALQAEQSVSDAAHGLRVRTGGSRECSVHTRTLTIELCALRVTIVRVRFESALRRALYGLGAAAPKERKSTLQYAKRYAVPTPIHVQTVTQSVVSARAALHASDARCCCSHSAASQKPHIRTLASACCPAQLPSYTCMTYMLCVYRFRVAAVSELQRQ